MIFPEMEISMNSIKGFLPLKLLSVIILGVSLFTIFAGSFWGIYIWETEMEFNDGNFIVEDYRQSPKFEELVNTRLSQLEEYIKLKEILETNGILNLNKVVVSTNGLEETVKQEYTIKELMLLNDFYIEDVYPVDNNTLNELFREKNSELIYKEVNYGNAGSSVVSVAEKTNEINFYQYKHKNGYIQILPGSYSEIDFVTNFLDKNDFIITENKYAALSKVKEIWKINNQSKPESPTDEPVDIELVDGQIMEVYTLDEIAYRFTYYVSFYTFYEELFSEGNTIFNYWILTPEESLTNFPIDKVVSSENMLSKIEETEGNYISYNSEVYQLNTNLSYINRMGLEGIKAAIIGEEDETFNIGIEILPYSEYADIIDEFVLDENEFKEGKTIINVMIISVIIAVILTFLCSAYLITAVGHKKSEEGIFLTKFDQVCSEVAAGILMIIGGIVAIPLILVIESYGREMFYVIVTIALTFIIEYILFMIGMASLIRRIKAKVLWKNSVCGHFVGFVKRIVKKCYIVLKELYLQRNITIRIAIIYGAWIFLLFFFVLIMFAFRNVFMSFLGLLLFIGSNLVILYLLVKIVRDYEKIIIGAQRIASGEINYKISDEKINGEHKRLVEAINNIRNGLAQAMESSIKNERMKTDLITNVSHDIKTPLTSIINYVDLLKRENIGDEKIKSYLEVLDSKSQRLKSLTEDLVEASKLSSGNMEFIIEEINFAELVTQVNGEFIEKFTDRNLTIVPNLPGEPAVIKVDGRRVWRILENLYNNASKYSMEGTRVYVDLVMKEKKAVFSIKNISEMQLNIKADELTERFIRGESSRTTEGSGLGLSIARSLTELMGGSFEVYLDGDLFRVNISFFLA